MPPTEKLRKARRPGAMLAEASRRIDRNYNYPIHLDEKNHRGLFGWGR